MKSCGPALFLLILLSIFGSAQNPQPVESNDNIVKVTTSIVQFDAVVTDKKGNQITNLEKDSFEVLQDGKPQTITHVEYINRSTIAASGDDSKAIENSTSAQSRAKPIGRVITFVVDDGSCDTTPESIFAIKTGLEKFVKEQMLDSDSIGIYRTRAGSSLFQQYTSDKTRIQEIIHKIRWYPPLGICSDDEDDTATNQSTLSGGSFQSDRDKETTDRMNNFTNDNQVKGVIGVLNYAVKGLYSVSGRKILFLVSSSLPMVTGNNSNNLHISKDAEKIKRLTVLANRASVVINSINFGGLNVPMLEARDSPNPKDTSQILNERQQTNSDREGGLAFVANETGGNFYKNINSLDLPIRKTLDREKGYYLIAYEPNEETFKGKGFHKITLKLKRDDLIISSRSGFYGVTDDQLSPKSKTADSELYRALTTPVPSSNVNLKLTAFYDNSQMKGDFIHAVLYIDGKSITFSDEPDGKKKAIIDIVAVTLTENNEVVDDSNKTATIHFTPAQADIIQHAGLLYSLNVPVKKEGVYTFRTALRDAASKQIGSASQLIEIPGSKKQKLLVSALKISEVDVAGKMLPAEGDDGVFMAVTTRANSAIRLFRQNTILGYTYSVFNSKPDPVTKKPNLTMQTKLYFDGKLLSTSAPQPINAGQNPDLNRMIDSGYLKINSAVEPGDYLLQIVVKDSIANQTSTQVIDFEVIK